MPILLSIESTSDRRFTFSYLRFWSQGYHVWQDHIEKEQTELHASITDMHSGCILGLTKSSLKTQKQAEIRTNQVHNRSLYVHSLLQVGLGFRVMGFRV